MRRHFLLVIVVIVFFFTGCSKSPEEKRTYYLKSAQEYVGQEKYAEAAIQYQNALKIAPDDVETLIKLGDVQLRLRRVEKAYDAFVSAARVDPKNIKALTNLASLNLLANKYDQAMQQAHTILTLDPKNIKAQNILAQGLYLSGKQEEALAIMDRIIKERESTEATLINAVQMYQGMGREDDALKLIERGISGYPNSSKLRFLASDIYAARNEVELSRRWAEEAYKVSKGDITAGITLAHFYVDHNLQDPLKSLLNDLKTRFPKDSRPFMLEAEAAWKKGDVNTALTLANQALEIDDTPATRHLLSKILLAQGDKEKAKQMLQKILDKDSNAIPSRLLLARIYLSEGNPDKTLEVLDVLMKQIPTHPDVAVAVSKAHLKKGNTEKALVSIEGSLKENPDHPSLHAMLADIYFKKGEYRDASYEVDKTLKVTPDALDVLYIGAITSIRLGQMEKAKAFIETMKKRNPNTWPKLYAEALYYGAKGDKAGVFRIAEKALKLWPENLDVLNLYAQSAPAVIGMQGAIKGIAPLCATSKSANCRMILSGLLEGAGRKDEAIETIKQAIELEPKRDEVYHYLAAFYVRNRMIKQALKEYEDILNKRPDDLKAATMLALLNHESGDIENAIKVYNYILERDPSHGIAANNLAWIIAERGKRSELDRALHLAMKAKEKFPDNPRIADTLGYIYLKKGIYANAQAQFSLALEKLPDEATINYHMALSLAKQGMAQEAMPYLKKALGSGNAFGEREDAQKLLSSLSTKQQ